MNSPSETHSVLVGYILWILGFMGAYRFYFGKPRDQSAGVDGGEINDGQMTNR
jgi:hypothetical protein